MKKSLFLSFFLLLSFGLLNAQDDADKELIQAIRKDFYHINEHLDEYEKVESLRGLIAYFKGDNIYKIVVPDERDKSITEYYFRGITNSLYFIFSHNEAVENRYYFNARKLIRWIDKDKAYRNQIDKDEIKNKIYKEAKSAYASAIMAWHNSRKNVFMIFENKYMLLNDLEPDFLLLDKGRPRNENPMDIVFAVDNDKLPNKYRSLINEPIWLYSIDGQRVQSRIIGFTFLMSVRTDFPSWDREAQLTTEEKFKKIDVEKWMANGYFYAILESPNNLQSIMASYDPSIQVYQSGSKLSPKYLKDKYIATTAFQKLKSEYHQVLESDYEGRKEFYDPEKNISFQSFDYPNKPTIYQIRTVGGNSCGGAMGDYYYDRLLMQKGDSFVFLSENGLEYDISCLFGFDNSEDLYFLYGLNLYFITGITKLNTEGEFENIVEQQFIFEGCGC